MLTIPCLIGVRILHALKSPGPPSLTHPPINGHPGAHLHSSFCETAATSPGIYHT